MLQSDARRIAAAIEERMHNGHPDDKAVTATVKADQERGELAAPGGGRPIFIRYHVEVTDGARLAVLGLDQASELLEDIEPGWDSDRLFDAIRSRGLPVEDIG